MKSIGRTALALFVSGLISSSAIAAPQIIEEAASSIKPAVDSSLVHQETDGRVVVEAENFFEQTKNEKRAFYRITKESAKALKLGEKKNHLKSAVGEGYIKVLPDTRKTHADKLIHGENFSNQPGVLAVVSYKVHFTKPGRYYVWVRAFSSGSEDNGIHVGLNGSWPEHGQRMQWCQGKHDWRWESKQRTAKEHCGVPHEIYLDIPKAGEHVISFSMREDGFEFDRFLMTLDRKFSRPTNSGPKSSTQKEVKN